MFHEKKPEPKVEYSKWRIPVGIDVSGRVFYIDLKEAIRVLFVASAGSGKSWLMRAMIDRLHQIGQACIFLTDIKGELVSSRKPLQAKFRHLLLKGEKPRRLPVAELRPTFFRQISKDLPVNNLWYSIDMKRMTQREFMTFMNTSRMTATQRTLLEIIYQEMSKKFKKEEDNEFSLDFIEEIIDNIDEIDTKSAKALKLKFRPLRESNWYIRKYERSIIEGIQKGLVPSINLTDFESFGTDNFNFPTVTESIVLREVIKGRRDKEIPPLWIFIDEATRFCGNDKNNSFKDEVLEAVDVERRFSTSVVMAFQAMSDIPEKVLYQSRYVFVPGTENLDTIKKILVNTGIARNVQSAPGLASRIKKQTRGHRYAWIVFDRFEQTMRVINPLAPLSHHMEAGE